MNLNISSEKVVENFSFYYTLITQKLNIWVNSFVLSIPNIVAVIFIITIFVLLSNLISKLSFKFLNRFTTSSALKRLFPSIIKWIVIIIGLIVCLEVLNLEKAVFSLLAGAGIMGIALGFAFQDLAANFIAGIYLTFMQPFKEGDIIKTSEYFGKIEKINFRNTILHTFEGQTVILPNRTIFEKPLINYNKTGKRRIEIRLPVAYNQNLEHITDILYKEVQSLKYILIDEDISIAAYEFGNYSINFFVSFWIEYPNSEKVFASARDSAIKAIKNALDLEGILIPLPSPAPPLNVISEPPPTLENINILRA